MQIIRSTDIKTSALSLNKFVEILKGFTRFKYYTFLRYIILNENRKSRYYRTIPNTKEKSINFVGLMKEDIVNSWFYCSIAYCEIQGRVNEEIEFSNLHHSRIGALKYFLRVSQRRKNLTTRTIRSFYN